MKMNTIGVSHMTLPESNKSESSHDETDLLLRASRRAHFIVLVMILALGQPFLGEHYGPTASSQHGQFASRGSCRS